LGFLLEGERDLQEGFLHQGSFSIASGVQGEYESSQEEKEQSGKKKAEPF
jgi:hypothetical protein